MLITQFEKTLLQAVIGEAVREGFEDLVLNLQWKERDRTTGLIMQANGVMLEREEQSARDELFENSLSLPSGPVRRVVGVEVRWIWQNFAQFSGSDVAPGLIGIHVVHGWSDHSVVGFSGNDWSRSEFFERLSLVESKPVKTEAVQGTNRLDPLPETLPTVAADTVEKFFEMTRRKGVALC